MKPKYIKHYKNEWKVRKQFWLVIDSKRHIVIYKKKLRKKLLRKYFKVLVFDQRKAIFITIDRYDNAK